MKIREFPLVLASLLMLSPLAAVTQAQTYVEMRTSATRGGSTVTNLNATGNVQLRIHNQASDGGRSVMNLEAAGLDGGAVRGQIFAANRGGQLSNRSALLAQGPGAVLDVRDYSVADQGEISHQQQLAVYGDGYLRCRSQQLAEAGGTSVTRHDALLQADSCGRNDVNLELLNDAAGCDATGRLRLRAIARKGGHNQHRITGAAVGSCRPAAIYQDIEHQAVGGWNSSDIQVVAH